MRILPFYLIVVRTVIFAILTIPFLHFSNVRDSILSSNEIGLYILCSICCISVIPLIGNRIYLSQLELAVFSLLIFVPIIQNYFVSGVSHLSMLKPFSYYIVFITISRFAKKYKSIILKFFYQSFFIIIHITLIVVFLQLLNFLPNFYAVNNPTAFFNNPGPFGIFLALSVVMAFYFLRKPFSVRNIYLVFFIFIVFYFLIQSDSRSAWISIIICLLMYIPLNKTILQNSLYIYIIVSFLIIIGYFLYIFKAQSANGRILIWLTSWEMFRENWIFGVGLERFSVNFLKYQASIFEINLFKRYLQNYADESQAAFNDILHFACERGIIGLTSILIIVKSILFSKYFSINSDEKKDIEILRCLLLIIIISGLFSYPLQTIPLSLIFWTSLGIYNSYMYKVRYSFTLNRSFMIIVILFIFSVTSYFTYYKYKSYRKWFQLEQRMSYKEENAMLSLYPFLYNRPSFLISLSKIYKVKGNMEKSIHFAEEAIALSSKKDHYYYLADLYKDNGFPNDAEKIYCYIENSIPHLIRPKYLRSLLYYDYDCDRFYPMAIETLRFHPKIESVYVYEMKQELIKRLKVQ
ncbi:MULTISPECIES: O-antigen ligase family protein [unclassified Sphingobacterium]|uniref:O-antigen ligase family protein n=1 Tax=unclassified Sphingobacterium TaxID=2609468 RepID=UPI0025D50C3F|nr:MULTISPECIES: O-antigen ligase family protein [unclassified Sphingobacterium]